MALVDPVTLVIERLTALEAPAAHLDRVPAPEGWALVFVSDGRPWVIDGIGALARPLSAGGLVEGPLSASPDGSFYAVVGRDVEASDVYVVRADGDGWSRITDEGDVTDAAWRPNP